MATIKECCVEIRKIAHVAKVWANDVIVSIDKGYTTRHCNVLHSSHLTYQETQLVCAKVALRKAQEKRSARRKQLLLEDNLTSLEVEIGVEYDEARKTLREAFDKLTQLVIDLDKENK
jgi:hypothetical protein